MHGSIHHGVGRIPYATLRLTWMPMAPMRKAERCMELLDLAPGWLDGEGRPPSHELLALVGECLEQHQRKDGQQPRLYPTLEGGVELEWRIGRLDLSIEFDPSSGIAEWHALDLDQGTVDEQRVALHDEHGMQALGAKLQRVLACCDQTCEA
jgi:hypothetical protein